MELLKRFLLYFEQWPTESLIRLIDLYTHPCEEVVKEAKKDPKIIELRVLMTELNKMGAKDKISAIRKAIFRICDS